MNYLKIPTRSLFADLYIFVDTENHGYEQIMDNCGVRLKRIREFIKEGSPFRLISCKVKKKDEALFRESMEKIRNKALLTGYRDYDEVCGILQKCKEE